MADGRNGENVLGIEKKIVTMRFPFTSTIRIRKVFVIHLSNARIGYVL